MVRHFTLLKPDLTLIVFSDEGMTTGEKTYRFEISSSKLKGIGKLFGHRKQIRECRVRATFVFNGQKIMKYLTRYDDEPCVTLYPNGMPFIFALVTKRQGYPQCNIGAWIGDPRDNLPANTTFSVLLDVMDGKTIIARSKRLIHNHGTNLSDLKVMKKKVN